MICCVCLNAAVDITYHVDSLVPGTSHRVREVRARAGGKSVNVARVLKQLGSSPIVTGFAGGRTGSAITEELVSFGVPHRMASTAAASRRTVTIVAESTTVLNERGGPVTRAEWTRLRDDFGQVCRDFECVVLSGSLPTGLPATAYARLTEIAHDHGVPVLLDAEGEPLHDALQSRPELVKPNNVEVADLLGRPVESAADAAEAGRLLMQRGAGSAVISRGADGLVAVWRDGALSARLAEPVSGNPTGAGDALAAVLARHLNENSRPDTLREAAAVSAAAVARPVAGEFAADLAERLRPLVQIEEL